MNSLRLILVEGDAGDAERITSTLERAGIAVDSLRVDTEDELRDALAAGGWEAIVAERVLPGWGALDALRVAQEVEFDGPFIVVSDDVDEEAIADALRAGAYDYVLKAKLHRLPSALELGRAEVKLRTGRRELEQRLNEAERLEAVGQLAGGIAHDFNNVLLVIRGYSSVLRATLTDEQQLADLDEIAKAADRAASLTRQLLAFGRREVFAPRVLGIGDVVRDLESLLRRTLREDIDLELHLDEVAPVLADPAQIELVLVNLVVNGRDAIAERGTLTVSVGETRLGEPGRAISPPLPPGAYVRLTVADTGCGIPEEHLARVFEPFFTTKKDGIGTGLGLSTVYGIVAQCAGGIGISTAPGEGTAISVYLPVAAEPASLDDPAGSSRPALERGSETILLVEDERPVRELVQRMLESTGYRVLPASLPSEAELLLARGQHVDLLLTDVVMPEMSGYELAARICGSRPDLRTLFISGYSHPAANAAPVGGELLKKPFAPDELASAVRRALERDMEVALA
jgi:two-component system, cell cycle sensor histidine kinase and response regulator CckA